MAERSGAGYGGGGGIAGYLTFGGRRRRRNTFEQQADGLGGVGTLFLLYVCSVCM